MKIFLVIFGVFAVLGIIAGAMLTMTFFGYVNQDVTLRAQAANTDSLNMTIKDECWKTISQVAQVSESYKDAFDSSYSNIMNARYDGDGKKGSQPPP